MKSDEIILTSPEGEEVYYYIVIEYPNLDANQNDDMGSSISGNITIEEGSEYQKPQVILTGSTTAGSNGWVQSASITTNITTHTGKYEAYYCTTTSDSCTPNTPANGSNNSFTTTLSSNASAQKVCVRVIDEYNQTTEGCSERYSVDTVNPTVSITNTSVTENTISVTVSGSDAHSGISEYRFSSNGGSSYTDITTTDSSYTYTFNNLESGTSYNIKIEIIDIAGNTNNVTKVIETDKNGNTMSEIIAGYNIGNRGSFDTPYDEITTKTVFTTSDWTGKISYYFAGAPTDNWVYFGGFYWRIIRINGDGSIRLIYNGTNTETIGTGTLIRSSQEFNTSYRGSYYVGLKYTASGNADEGQHGQDIESNILKILNDWYNNSLSTAQYSQYIDSNIGFCSDRVSYSDAAGTNMSWTAYGNIYYAAYVRLYVNDNPRLTCSSSDIIKIPIGLVTADEVSMAGGVGDKNNTSYYLYNSLNYWTMSPSSSNTVSARGYLVSTDGELSMSNINSTYGVRPVINLKSNTHFTGTGTATDPYVVV